jgi:hypothetical protein
MPGGEAADEATVVGVGDGGGRVVDPPFDQCKVFVAGGQDAAGDEYCAQPRCGFGRVELVQQSVFERAGRAGRGSSAGCGLWLVAAT